MNIKSFAKINVSLRNLGVRPEDGYHELEMVNLPIDLHDVITIDPLPFEGDTYITCNDLRLLGLKGNLCTKALEAMRERYGFKENFRISIHKNIPFAAGLGGGSSNAACVMLALDQMLKLHATKEDLGEIGLRLGADVPFFLNPKPCLVTGIGEKASPIPVKGVIYCLVVKPAEGLSTKDVYAICDSLPKEEIDTKGVLEGLENQDLNQVARCRGNDLYAPAKSLLPKIEDIVSALKTEGFSVAAMSGSGSACFGLTLDHRLALKAERKFIKAGYIVRLSKVLN